MTRRHNASQLRNILYIHKANMAHTNASHKINTRHAPCLSLRPRVRPLRSSAARKGAASSRSPRSHVSSDYARQSTLASPMCVFCEKLKTLPNFSKKSEAHEWKNTTHNRAFSPLRGYRRRGTVYYIRLPAGSSHGSRSPLNGYPRRSGRCDQFATF